MEQLNKNIDRIATAEERHNMAHDLSKDDPLFYKLALKGLLDEAKENGITITVQENRITFDDRKEFRGTLIPTTVCSVEI